MSQLCHPAIIHLEEAYDTEKLTCLVLELYVECHVSSPQLTIDLLKSYSSTWKLFSIPSKVPLPDSAPNFSSIVHVSKLFIEQVEVPF